MQLGQAQSSLTPAGTLSGHCGSHPPCPVTPPSGPPPWLVDRVVPGGQGRGEASITFKPCCHSIFINLDWRFLIVKGFTLKTLASFESSHTVLEGTEPTILFPLPVAFVPFSLTSLTCVAGSVCLGIWKSRDRNTRLGPYFHSLNSDPIFMFLLLFYFLLFYCF